MKMTLASMTEKEHICVKKCRFGGSKKTHIGVFVVVKYWAVVTILSLPQTLASIIIFMFKKYFFECFVGFKKTPKTNVDNFFFWSFLNNWFVFVGLKLTSLDLRELVFFKLSWLAAIKRNMSGLRRLTLGITTRNLITSIQMIDIEKDFNIKNGEGKDDPLLSDLEYFHLSGPFGPEVVTYILKGKTGIRVDVVHFSSFFLEKLEKFKSVFRKISKNILLHNLYFLTIVFGSKRPLLLCNMTKE
jgi:hypothetical protein